MKRCIAAIAVCAAALSIGCAAAADGNIGKALIPAKTIALPGGTSRFDYQSIDPRRRLLFIAHLGDSSIDVIDLRTQTVRSVIHGVSGVHGVLAVPQLDRVYASATGSSELAVIDERTLRVIARVPGGNYPDGIAYAAPEHKIYISDEAGGTDTVVDVRTNRRVTTIPLGGEAGNTEFDPVRNRIYVNAQTVQELITIDPRRDRIIGRERLPYCRNNHGLLLNVGAAIAYIACDGNATLLTYDLGAHKIIAKNRVGDGPDVLAYDQKNQRLYVAAESGVVAAFVVGADGSLSEIGMGELAPNAHSVAVDPATGYVYFPIRSGGGRPELNVYEAADVE